MKNKLVNVFKTYPVFVWVLPVFFVLHSFIENFNLVPLEQALELIFTYLLITIALVIVFNFFYKKYDKSYLLVFVIMSYNFFFGSAHDFLKKHLSNMFITKYSFILPFSFGLIILLFIYLKKTKRNFKSITQYLNLLLVLLIIVDTGNLVSKMSIKKRSSTIPPPNFLPCDSCQKPDVYLIIADEYAGNAQLKEMFSFDNSDFENSLKQRGFHILKNSSSNYNWTLYSMASMLNMNYLPDLKDTIINIPDKFYCSELIKNSNVAALFKNSGYAIYNYSFFDFAGTTKSVKPVFLPATKTLITAQTFINRIQHDLWFNFVSPQFITNVLSRNLYNNIIIDSLTKVSVMSPSNAPRFVYTHLTMPHYPYYFDSSGNKRKSEQLMDENNPDKQAYLQYLVYCNKKLLELLDFIKFNSAKPPIIMLMSDHGFRQYKPLKKSDKQFQFCNLNALFFPNGNYMGFSDTLYNVNQFRVLFNSQFQQKFPLLKDSTIFLIDP